jgi:hypothetical protein
MAGSFISPLLITFVPIFEIRIPVANARPQNPSLFQQKFSQQSKTLSRCGQKRGGSR